MYFCLLHKNAGTGSELHYHPNELLIFPVRQDQRHRRPGPAHRQPGHFRACARFCPPFDEATEDGPCQYLYIKDKTWTVVGLAEDEAVPEKAMTVAEVNKKYNVGDRDKHQKAQGKSQASSTAQQLLLSYPGLARRTAVIGAARQLDRGQRLAFGFFEVPAGYDEPQMTAEHEMFIYVLSGKLSARAGPKARAPLPATSSIFRAARLTSADAVGICPLHAGVFDPVSRKQNRRHDPGGGGTGAGQYETQLILRFRNYHNY